MKAAVYYKNGGPEVFRYEDVPDPGYLPDQVLIKIKSISIEGGDAINREIRPLNHIPNIVGYQSAGEIVAIGAEVTDFKVGDRVVAITPFGSHAEFVAAQSIRTFLLPDNLTFEEGSAIPTAFFAAYECLFTFGHLVAGQTVLIHGGTGALGIAAIQMAKNTGATVIATGADNDKLAKLKSLGTDNVINYRISDFAQKVMEITGNQGVNLIIDPVGGSNNLFRDVSCLIYGGIISFVGVSGRDTSLFDPIWLWPKNATITGIYAPSSTDNEPERFRQVVCGIIKDVSQKKLRVIIDRSFPLSKAAEAHQYILDKKAFGRVLLIPGQS